MSYLSSFEGREVKMKIYEVIGNRLHPEIERLLGPDMPIEIRAQIEDVFRRNPPPRMSPEEMRVMYNPNYEDELLQRRKLRADVAKAEAEAALARAKADAQRRGINRPS